MRFIFLSFLLLFQTVSASVNLYKLKDINVIISDDCNLPIAKVGIIYPIGLNQLHNICEVDLIQELLFSKETQLAIKKMGATASFEAYENFSELSVIIPINQIDNFIKILLNNQPNTKEFDICKDRIKLNYKLSDYFETQLLTQEIYATTNKKYIYNESILENLSLEDFLKTIDSYKASHIIICGQIKPGQLAKKLNLSSHSITPKKYTFKPLSSPFKDTEIKSKFKGRSILYMYQLHEQPENLNAILFILNYEMFYYFQKYSQILNSFSILTLQQSPILTFKFAIKRDISMKSFETIFNNFFTHIKNTNFSTEKLQKISKQAQFEEVDIEKSVTDNYKKLLYRYILNLPEPNKVSATIKHLSSDDIKQFVNQLKTVAKISTQYKAEH